MLHSRIMHTLQNKITWYVKDVTETQLLNTDCNIYNFPTPLTIFHGRVLQYLYDNTWIDVYTQAVFVEFTVYNANVNLFCIVTLMFETTATGT